ncbi:MAG: LPP20 family lipoprotein [Nitrospiraceae bacterium]
MSAIFTIISSLVSTMLWASISSAADTGDDTAAVRQRANQAFERPHQPAENQRTRAGVSREGDRSPALAPPSYSPDSYLIGTGHGDLGKGRITCQRVAELSARTDLAKQIRVLVKEHAIDRVRERTGHNSEQDIEIVREEIVQEYLQGVKIIDRRFDEANGTCSSTAVMPKQAIPSDLPREAPASPPTSAR